MVDLEHRVGSSFRIGYSRQFPAASSPKDGGRDTFSGSVTRLASAVVVGLGVLLPPPAFSDEQPNTTSPQRQKSACSAWRTRIEHTLTWQSQFGLVHPDLARALAAEAHRISERCGQEPWAPLLGRYVAIEKFLYDDAQEAPDLCP